MLHLLFGLFRTNAALLASLNGWLLAMSVTIATFVGYTYWQRSIGADNATKIITNQIETEAKKADAAAHADHSHAARPGAFDRLRADPRTCPDCIKNGDGKPVPKLAPSDNRAK
jgi:hypothetical protein